MIDDSVLGTLFPTPEDIDALGDDAIQELLQLTKSYAPIRVQFADPAQAELTQELEAHFALAKAAALKFKSNGYPTLTEQERQALHAFVHLVTRPSLQVREGTVVAIPQSWGELEQRRDVVQSFLPGVGRLDRIDCGSRVQMATGWFIAEDLLITNNHVVAGLCDISPHEDPEWRKSLDQVIGSYNERWEHNPHARPIWDPAEAPGAMVDGGLGRVVHADLHPKLDMALLRVEGVEGSKDLVIPVSKNGPAHKSHFVYTLGYPAIEVDEIYGYLHPALVKLLFAVTKSEMTKRVAPGQLSSLTAASVQHDATTLGGNSGSPVMDFDEAHAIGLHFSGSYGFANYAIPFWQHHQDPFFANHGVKFV